MKIITEHIDESISVKKKILADKNLIDLISCVANQISKSIKNGGKVILAGNGGSAADSQHIAAEFISKLNFDRPSLPAIALTTDTSILTAIGNDYGFENLFSRQLSSMANKKDVFIGITTSGKSPNILNALNYTKENNIYSVVFTGLNSNLDKLSDITIKVPSKKTPFIQESHIMIGHIICGIAERNLFPNLR